MATQQVLLSPAELDYLRTSLSLRPPIRPDGRAPTQFRPLTAETGILQGTNGSACVTLADGTEAVVGIKAEIGKTTTSVQVAGADEEEVDGGNQKKKKNKDASKARGDWVEITVEIPSQRDDDAGTVFLGEMLKEALLGDGEFTRKLVINSRFHWRLYIDILLLSPPLSYPLPLLSLTTHLALLASRLPRLKSEGDEDPMFDDDWETSTFLYSRDKREEDTSSGRPPITLLVIVVGDNIIFDPSKEELAVAETALAVSVAEVRRQGASNQKGGDMEIDSARGARELKLLSIRMIDPPSRLTPPGVPNGTGGPDGNGDGSSSGQTGGAVSKQQRSNPAGEPGVWTAPLGGTKFAVLDGIIQAVLEKNGVAHEVLDGLEGVDLS